MRQTSRRGAHSLLKNCLERGEKDVEKHPGKNQRGETLTLNPKP